MTGHENGGWMNSDQREAVKDAAQARCIHYAFSTRTHVMRDECTGTVTATTEVRCSNCDKRLDHPHTAALRALIREVDWARRLIALRLPDAKIAKRDLEAAIAQARAALGEG